MTVRQHTENVASLSGTQWFAVALALLTGALHLYAGAVEGRIPVALAGVGYAGAIVLYYVGYRRRLLALVGIPYTLVQFPLWYSRNAGEFAMVGYVDKTVQVVLVVVLAYLYWSGRQSGVKSDRSSAA